MKLSKLCHILRYVLVISFIVLVFSLIGLPLLLKILEIKFNLVYSMLYPSGIAFLFLIIQFIKLFKILEVGKTFSREVIKLFNNSMISVFFISFIILIMIILSIFKYHYEIIFILSSSFMMILFFGVGIALYMLKILFMQALDFKEENDLTI